ncbi:MAG: DUF1883 domain-containing protein [Chloroflexota bacterium]|nr:DUF1883 domain-containing protein [Chloroflexota bacterium]
MSYLKFDLGSRADGDVVQVTLQGTEANVFLVNETGLHAYESHRQFRYWGGHFRRSPVILQVPYAGTWYVVVDLGGGAGRVEAAVQVLAA